MPLHPDAIKVMDWTPDPADITPEMSRRFCETGDLTALDDILRLGVKRDHLAAQSNDSTDAARDKQSA